MLPISYTALVRNSATSDRSSCAPVSASTTGNNDTGQNSCHFCGMRCSNDIVSGNFLISTGLQALRLSSSQNKMHLAILLCLIRRSPTLTFSLLILPSAIFSERYSSMLLAPLMTIAHSLLKFLVDSSHTTCKRTYFAILSRDCIRPSDSNPLSNCELS